MYIMSRYNCNFSCFRPSVPVYFLTQTYNDEKSAVDELIQYLTVDAPFTEPILDAAYFMEVEGRSGSMTQEEYNTYVKMMVQTFDALLQWCTKYDKLEDFNNFESGWSISLSIYHG